MEISKLVIARDCLLLFAVIIDAGSCASDDGEGGDDYECDGPPGDASFCGFRLRKVCNSSTLKGELSVFVSIG